MENNYRDISQMVVCKSMVQQIQFSIMKGEFQKPIPEEDKIECIETLAN